MPLREYPLQGSPLGKHVVWENEVTQVVVVADQDARVAQEASASHHEYIDRKKQNLIFTPM